MKSHYIEWSQILMLLKHCTFYLYVVVNTTHHSDKPESCLIPLSDLSFEGTHLKKSPISETSTWISRYQYIKYILHVITTILNCTTKSFENTCDMNQDAFLVPAYETFLSLEFRTWHQSCDEILLNFKSFTLVFFLHIIQAFIHIPQFSKKKKWVWLYFGFFSCNSLVYQAQFCSGIILLRKKNTEELFLLVINEHISW